MALALGGAKVPIAQVSGEAYTFTPPAAPSPSVGTDVIAGPGGPGSFGGDGGERPGGGGTGDGTPGGESGYPGSFDFYPIQPVLSSFLPEASFPLVAGGPVPSLETGGGQGGSERALPVDRVTQGRHSKESRVPATATATHQG